MFQRERTGFAKRMDLQKTSNFKVHITETQDFWSHSKALYAVFALTATTTTATAPIIVVLL